MGTKNEIQQKKLKGLLICPLRKGFIEFEYSPGDRIKDLDTKVQELWGEPDSGHEKYWPRVEVSGWYYFCETLDGDYLRLDSSSKIPTEPPSKTAGDSVKGYGGKMDILGTKAEGAVVESDLSKKIFELNFDEKDNLGNEIHNIKLVVLVAIMGG